MDKMKELYKKVAGDGDLQAKYAKIMSDAEKDGAQETGRKLLEFAKEAGYDMTLEEIQGFFSMSADAKEGALSEDELDSVAGGKGSIIPSSIDPIKCNPLNSAIVILGQCTSDPFTKL
ncbi:MAG: Nif11-like leader peptide family RiPP precursor [Eubacteriales bacterium]|nr:Nif11-like leader peptide family RiPP precursor [Eubacteriales bacterium]MDD3199739.1 Nif11-like leader peptide family RiPP precursor [Eubacteriales bacterium]MDD4121332.1 Nif11-like leader peptide family RiPP precursor [Eubacteriales bacterium]MDD4630177.1 Nif11-like leader peptide family RiPP precursor [Eubacteriales bacterium]